MPPAVRILVLVSELIEGQDGVLVKRRAERGTLKISILDVDMVVELRVVLTADHRKEQYVLIVDGWIGNLEPELDGVFAGPLLERGSVEANIALS